MNSYFKYLVLLVLLFTTQCKTENTQTIVTSSQQIKILNGCGITGAASQLRSTLIDKGFDVVEYANASHWNYYETIIVSHVQDRSVADYLGKILDIKNVIHILDTTSLVDLVIFVGKDFNSLHL